MDTPTRIRALHHGLGAGYLGILAYLTAGYWNAPLVPIVAAAAAVGLFMARFAVFREILRGVAVIQAVAAILSFRIYIKSFRLDFPSIEEIAAYILAGIALPLLVAAFICVEHRKPVAAGDLPLGYEHLERHYKPMPAGVKLLIILGVCLGMVAQMMSIILMAFIFVLPVGLALYWLISMLRERKKPVPTAARRISLSPKMERPAQTRNHWTVNSSEFEDPDMYR
jgi:hypothetical protein